MAMKMQFPTGLSYFTDKNGVKQTPDVLGQVDIDQDDMGFYLLAGFFPVGYLDVITALHVTDAVDAALAALMALAMDGDLVFVVTPATKSTAHAVAASRTVAIQLQTAAGAVHTWFNKAIATGVAIAKSSTSGTATIPSTTLTFVAGVASVVITIGGTWAGADTDTLTVAAATLLGYTVAAKTSVETMT